MLPQYQYCFLVGVTHVRETTLLCELKVYILSIILALYIIRFFVYCRGNRYHHLCLTMKVLIFKLLEILIIVIVT